MADLTGMLQAAAGSGVDWPPSNIQFVGSTTLSTPGKTGDTSVSLTSLQNGIGTQPAQGDLVIALAGAGVGTTFKELSIRTSGYTELVALQANDNISLDGTVAYKFMGATPDTTIIVSGTLSATDGISAVFLVFRNVDQTDPFPVLEIANSQINTARPTPPDLTPPAPSEGAFHILCGGAGAHGQGDRDYANSLPYTNFATEGVNDSYDSTTAMGAIELTSDILTGGVFDPPRFVWVSGTDNSQYSSAAFTAVMRST